MRTLIDAINEGLQAVTLPENEAFDPAEVIKAHVLDWFRQKFCIAYMDAADENPQPALTIVDRLARVTGVKDPDGIKNSKIKPGKL